MIIKDRQVYIVGDKFVPHGRDHTVSLYHGYQQTSRRILEKDGGYLLDFQCLAFYHQGGNQAKAGIIIGEGYSVLSNTDLGSKELAYEAVSLVDAIEAAIYEHYKALAPQYNYSPWLYFRIDSYNTFLHLSLRLWKYDNITLYNLQPEDFK